MTSEYQILRYILYASIIDEKTFILDDKHLNFYGVLNEENYTMQLTMTNNMFVNCLVQIHGSKKDNNIHYNRMQIKLFLPEFTEGKYVYYNISIDRGSYTDLELAMIFSRRFKDTELTKNKDTLDFIMNHLEDMT